TVLPIPDTRYPIPISKTLRSCVSILRRQLDGLFVAGDRYVQAPFQILVAGQNGMDPPVARRNGNGSPALLVESGSNQRASPHALVPKFIKAFAGVRLCLVFLFD